MSNGFKKCGLSPIMLTTTFPHTQKKAVPQKGVMTTLFHLHSFSMTPHDPHVTCLDFFHYALYVLAMSSAKLRLMCLIWPDDRPDQHIVEVEIDDGETIGDLKKLIKDKHASMLNKVAACELVLWRCSISADENLQNILNAVRFDGTAADLLCLPPASLVSEHFATALFPKTIHILVEVPALGEYYEQDLVRELPEFRSTFSLTFTLMASSDKSRVPRDYYGQGATAIHKSYL